jgi:ATPase subunit of ABC transporter with duplicated ATPase domains
MQKQGTYKRALSIAVSTKKRTEKAESREQRRQRAETGESREIRKSEKREKTQTAMVVFQDADITVQNRQVRGGGGVELIVGTRVPYVCYVCYKNWLSVIT